VNPETQELQDEPDGKARTIPEGHRVGIGHRRDRVPVVAAHGPAGEHTGFDTITDGQWVTAVLAFLVALGINGGVTYRVPNRQSSPAGSTDAAAAPAKA